LSQNPPKSDPITTEALFPTLEALLKATKAAGAESADVVATHGRSLGIAVRDNALEDVESSEGRDIGLRVIIGKRQACVSSSDLSPASMQALAERAVAMAKLAPEDPYCGLPGRYSGRGRKCKLVDQRFLLRHKSWFS